MIYYRKPNYPNIVYIRGFTMADMDNTLSWHLNIIQPRKKQKKKKN